MKISLTALLCLLLALPAALPAFQVVVKPHKVKKHKAIKHRRS
jgi:hypothetical protein